MKTFGGVHVLGLPKSPSGRLISWGEPCPPVGGPVRPRSSAFLFIRFFFEANLSEHFFSSERWLKLFDLVGRPGESESFQHSVTNFCVQEGFCESVPYTLGWGYPHQRLLRGVSSSRWFGRSQPKPTDFDELTDEQSTEYPRLKALRARTEGRWAVLSWVQDHIYIYYKHIYIYIWAGGLFGPPWE